MRSLCWRLVSCVILFVVSADGAHSLGQPSVPVPRTWNGWCAVELFEDGFFLVVNNTDRAVVFNDGFQPPDDLTVLPGESGTVRAPRYVRGGFEYAAASVRAKNEDATAAVALGPLGVKGNVRIRVEVVEGVATLANEPPSVVGERVTRGTFVVEGPADERGGITRISDQIWIRNASGEWFAGYLRCQNPGGSEVRTYRIDVDPDQNVSVDIPELAFSYGCRLWWTPLNAAYTDRQIGEVMMGKDWTFEALDLPSNFHRANTGWRTMNVLQDRDNTGVTELGPVWMRPSADWIPLRLDTEWSGEVEIVRAQSERLEIENRTNRVIAIGIVTDTPWSATPFAGATFIQSGQRVTVQSTPRTRAVNVWPPEEREPLQITVTNDRRAVHVIDSGVVAMSIMADRFEAELENTSPK